MMSTPGNEPGISIGQMREWCKQSKSGVIDFLCLSRKVKRVFLPEAAREGPRSRSLIVVRGPSHVATSKHYPEVEETLPAHGGSSASRLLAVVR
jgi:hypothetical protein